MTHWTRLYALLRTELQHLTHFQRSDRLWQMALAAAFAIGLPILAGAYFDHLNYGLVASVGGLTFLYLPNTPLSHRMVTVMVCAFAMSACYAFGVLIHSYSMLTIPMIVLVATLVTMICRFYMLGPPGSLFFVMAASIGAYTPVELAQAPHMVGLISIGALQACVIAFLYSIYALRLRAPQPVAALPPPTFDFVVFDSVIIGLFVGVSLAAAQALQLQRPYWVPISCIAVIQGASLRAIWNRQLQRIVGTGIGMLLAWSVLSLPFNRWSITIALMVLSFVSEMLVVRHYAIAMIFITPLTLLLADAANLGHTSPAALIQARFMDTVIGCMFGLVGGICLHSPQFRRIASVPLRCLIPARFNRSEP